MVSRQKKKTKTRISHFTSHFCSYFLNQCLFIQDTEVKGCIDISVPEFIQNTLIEWIKNNIQRPLIGFKKEKSSVRNMNKICFRPCSSSIRIKFETKCLPSRKFWWDFSNTSIITCTNCLPLNKNPVKTNCETRMIPITEPPRQVASPDISASCTSPTKVATRWQQQSDIKFSAALWCGASLLYYIYLRGGVWVSGGKKKKI